MREPKNTSLTLKPCAALVVAVGDPWPEKICKRGVQPQVGRGAGLCQRQRCKEI